MIRPGSIIDGPLRRLQKEVINIGTGRNNIERERLKVLMEEMEKRDEAAHVAGVRNQMPSVSYKNDENVAQDGVEQSDPQYAEDVDGERPSPGGDLLASSDMSLMSERNLNECFIVSKNHVLMGASPFERRVAMTKAKCAQFCLSLDYCISASYSSSDFTCDAFNTKNGSGSARLFEINDYFYLEPKPGESAVCLAGGCRSGEAVVFQQSVEWRLTRKTGQETEFVSTEEDCVFACSINLAKDSAPLECSSAVYDSWSRICTLSMLSAGQDRNDDLSSDPHAEEVENCVLNRSTRVERPDDFAEEPVSPVDYVGLDECLATKRIPLLSVMRNLIFIFWDSRNSHLYAHVKNTTSAFIDLSSDYRVSVERR
ncbi:unnamed protein product [Toxocara canis]|uniref:Apple domain-containing protein n=1 Tax=Toxocara canis TaxID=6265 RepID=A0A183UXD4_TOXCA|nr:unnamed protein product [Toxocara canis]